MKTVLLIRHGKSDWKAGIKDIERPLNARGIKNSETMAKVIQQTRVLPQILFYSIAKRTEQTAFLLAKYLNFESNNMIACPELYLCQPEAIYDLIHFAPTPIDTIAIIGHNPAITEVAGSLGNDRALHMPTLAISQLMFETNEWKDVNRYSCIGHQLFTPKNH